MKMMKVNENLATLKNVLIAIKEYRV